LCASVAKQYNLVPAKRVDLFGWEVTAGLVEKTEKPLKTKKKLNIHENTNYTEQKLKEITA